VVILFIGAKEQICLGRSSYSQLTGNEAFIWIAVLTLLIEQDESILIIRRLNPDVKVCDSPSEVGHHISEKAESVIWIYHSFRNFVLSVFIQVRPRSHVRQKRFTEEWWGLTDDIEAVFCIGLIGCFVWVIGRLTDSGPPAFWPPL